MGRAAFSWMPCVGILLLQPSHRVRCSVLSEKSRTIIMPCDYATSNSHDHRPVRLRHLRELTAATPCISPTTWLAGMLCVIHLAWALTTRVCKSSFDTTHFCIFVSSRPEWGLIAVYSTEWLNTLYRLHEQGIYLQMLWLLEQESDCLSKFLENSLLEKSRDNSA